MPVFIDQPDAFKKICQVEEMIDENYSKTDIQESLGVCGFFAFKEAWEQAVARNPKIKEKGKDLAFTVEGNSAIYGAKGYNRYAVMYSGEILFIKDLAINMGFIAIAEQAGFRVF